jgi:hypothetical protein
VKKHFVYIRREKKAPQKNERTGARMADKIVEYGGVGHTITIKAGLKIRAGDVFFCDEALISGIPGIYECKEDGTLLDLVPMPVKPKRSKMLRKEVEFDKKGNPVQASAPIVIPDEEEEDEEAVKKTPTRKASKPKSVAKKIKK